MHESPIAGVSCVLRHDNEFRTLHGQALNVITDGNPEITHRSGNVDNGALVRFHDVDPKRVLGRTKASENPNLGASRRNRGDLAETANMHRTTGNLDVLAVAGDINNLRSHLVVGRR